MAPNCLIVPFVAVFNALASRFGRARKNNEEFPLTSEASPSFTMPQFFYAVEKLPEELGFENIKLLGQGCFGSVIVCNAGAKARQVFTNMINIPKDVFEEIIAAENPKSVALKITEVSSVEPSKLDSYIREVRMINSLDHPNIIKQYASFALHCSTDEQGEKVVRAAEKGLPLPQRNDTLFGFIIMERLGPNLAQLMKTFNMDHLVEAEIRHLFLCVSDAVAYLYTLNIVHSDIHPGNIVTSLTGDDLDRTQVFTSAFKLIDFGVAHQYDPMHTMPGLLAQADSESALRRWRDEKTFLNRKPGVKPTVPSFFKSESGDVGRMFARLSIKGGMLNHRFEMVNMMSIFHKKTLLKSPTLRQAILMLGTVDQTQQITIPDARALVLKERA